MKKREWDKDIFNYEKAREWLGKNHLLVIFLLAMLAIPVLFVAVRYAITHNPSITDTTIAGKIGNNNVDFVTPALYYFSSIAQTMGAIIGLALAAMYAIMPNIRSSKDNPAFEPARRLLQRDEYFRRSINVGSVCILVSLLGLLFIYVTASSQSWAFVLLLFLGVTALGLGVYSLGTMFYFIRVRMPKYFSLSEIPLLAFGNQVDEIQIKSTYEALTYAELILLIDMQGMKHSYMFQSLSLIKYAVCKFDDKQKFDDKFEKRINELLLFTTFDTRSARITESDNRQINISVAIAIWKSFINNKKLFVNDVNKNSRLMSFIINIINEKLSITIQENLEIDLFNMINNGYFYFDKNSLLTLYNCDKLTNVLYNIIKNNDNIYDIFSNQPYYLVNDRWVPNENTLMIFLLIVASGIELNTNVLDKILGVYYKASINILMQISHLISLKESIGPYINMLENTITYAYIILEIEYDKYYPYLFRSSDSNSYIDVFRFLLDFKPKGDSIFSNDNLTIRRYLHLFDYKLACVVYSSMKYKKPKLKDFVYTIFIPYLERHGIGVNDNPEYLAIIRKRTKDIKEPELDF